MNNENKLSLKNLESAFTYFNIQRYTQIESIGNPYRSVGVRYEFVDIPDFLNNLDTAETAAKQLNKYSQQALEHLCDNGFVIAESIKLKTAQNAIQNISHMRNTAGDEEAIKYILGESEPLIQIINVLHAYLQIRPYELVLNAPEQMRAVEKALEISKSVEA